MCQPSLALTGLPSLAAARALSFVDVSDAKEQISSKDMGGFFFPGAKRRI